MYNYSFEHNKYKHIKQPSRIYPNKYFGNDFGISLENQVNQGYTYDLKKLTPIFNQTNDNIKLYMKEDFSQPDGLKSVNKYLSKTSKEWPYKYYNNKFGHSLQHIIKNKYPNKKKEEKKEEMKVLSKKNIRSGPYKYNSNDYGISLESITKEGGMAGLAFYN